MLAPPSLPKIIIKYNTESDIQHVHVSRTCCFVNVGPFVTFVLMNTCDKVTFKYGFSVRNRPDMQKELDLSNV